MINNDGQKVLTSQSINFSETHLEAKLQYQRTVVLVVKNLSKHIAIIVLLMYRIMYL